VRVGRADDLDAGSQCVADVLATEVEAEGKAVDLERDFEHALRVEGVLRPTVDVAPRRMAEATHARFAQRCFDALGHVPSRHPLPTVHAFLHPVELGEDVLGKVKPPVRKDVALNPAQHAKRRQ